MRSSASGAVSALGGDVIGDAETLLPQELQDRRDFRLVRLQGQPDVGSSSGCLRCESGWWQSRAANQRPPSLA
jgi:hypothetical protein